VWKKKKHASAVKVCMHIPIIAVVFRLLTYPTNRL
jgi:hypothetical protein